MKIDAFMPFYGSEFFNAVAGLSNEIIGIYMRCCWHYWSHTNCDGLPDDDEYLRELCRVDAAKWTDKKSKIFNGFLFKKTGGKWHQKRCKEEYAKALELREKRKQQTDSARNARWKRYSVTES